MVYSAWWGKTFVDTLSDVCKEHIFEYKPNSIGAIQNNTDNPKPEVVKSVSFSLDDSETGSSVDDSKGEQGEEGKLSEEHQDFLKKQAAAITAKDFVNSPKPGTPVQTGEFLGANGKPIPYRMKSPEQADGLIRSQIRSRGY
jgi:hypothetical protein